MSDCLNEIKEPDTKYTCGHDYRDHTIVKHVLQLTKCAFCKCAYFMEE